MSGILLGRLVVRMVYYGYRRWNMAKPAVKHGLAIVKSFTHLPTPTEKISVSPDKDQSQNEFEEPVMPLIAFHRPFRRLLRSSIILSSSLSFLYMHCWNRDLKGFGLDGPICNAFFFWSSYSDQENRIVAEENLWFIWIVAIILTLMSYTEEEFAGQHFRSRQRNHNYMKEGVYHDGEDQMEDLPESNHDLLSPSKIKFFHKKGIEQPSDTLPMVPWFSVMLIASVFDILVQLKVFLGRYDARTLQPVLNQKRASRKKQMKESKHTKSTSSDDDVKPRECYPGCVFDYRHKEKSNNKNEGFWFDFVADTGDGFNSSYQVSKLLADPSLFVLDKNNTRRKLPRGSLLLIGGDLAYPEPNEYNYEKRFFRTFEDAMPPPASFRRAAISTFKPALTNIGWRGCFEEDKAADEEEGMFFTLISIMLSDHNIFSFFKLI